MSDESSIAVGAPYNVSQPLMKQISSIYTEAKMMVAVDINVLRIIRTMRWLSY